METIMQDISTGPVGEGEDIESGQCFSFIAFMEDIAWDTAWDHEDNEELRLARLHPNILLPGDKVTIPPKNPVVVQFMRPVF